MTSARLRGLSRAPLAAAMLCTALVLAACGGGSGPQAVPDVGGAPVAGGTATYALPAGATPNWILPLLTGGKTATHNTSVRYALWTPLYGYTAESGQLTFDAKASLATGEPSWSADGRTATITLNDQTWSDGRPVTSRDVEFWFNLVKANTAQWAPYVRGNFPDNVTAFTAVDDKTFSMTFDQAYNQQWVQGNQLTLMYAIPQHAWDKDSQGGAVGDLDRDPAAAQRVWAFLVDQASALDTYATNPLWKVVNGPFTLEAFSTTGHVTLRRNPAYTGPDPAHLDTVELLPFTSEDAAFNAVLAGDVDYGYVPIAALAQRPRVERQGYRVENWDGWAITYAPYNFAEPVAGPIFRQDYVRQAIQRSVDQTGIAEVIWKGTAEPGFGPAPQQPANDYVSDAQRSNPYPFDNTAAKALLTGNGWQTGPDGVAVCANAGVAPGQCGDGIAPGTRLQFEMYTQSGSAETDAMMQELQSSLARTGIAMTIRTAPLNTVLADTARCAPGAPCGWQASFFGARGSWYLQPYPLTDRQFASAGTGNFGSYGDPQADSLENAARVSNDADSMRAVSELVSTDLPGIWLPSPVYQVSAIRSDLGGVVQDPLAVIHPQRWYRTS